MIAVFDVVLEPNCVMEGWFVERSGCVLGKLDGATYTLSAVCVSGVASLLSAPSGIICLLGRGVCCQFTVRTCRSMDIIAADLIMCHTMCCKLSSLRCFCIIHNCAIAIMGRHKLGGYVCISVVLAPVLTGAQPATANCHGYSANGSAFKRCLCAQSNAFWRLPFELSCPRRCLLGSASGPEPCTNP